MMSLLEEVVVIRDFAIYIPARVDGRFFAGRCTVFTWIGKYSLT